ncbi:MAG: hypothetical protein F6K10_05495 [Moorea sp. SIO2B7]|nr:hypothetical protein [Moorena sp. SIO2B7]
MQGWGIGDSPENELFEETTDFEAASTFLSLRDKEFVPSVWETANCSTSRTFADSNIWCREIFCLLKSLHPLTP